MLKQARRYEEAAPTGKVVALPPSRFARDASAYATIKGVQRWLQKRSAPS
jgi:hypothetical protein